MTVAQQTCPTPGTAPRILVDIQADPRQVRQTDVSVAEGQESLFLQHLATRGPLFLGQQRWRDECQLLPLGTNAALHWTQPASLNPIVP